MPALDHTHSYVRVRGSKTLFRCNDPNCSHTQQKRFLEGKNSACPNCGTVFQLDNYDLNYLAKPVCHKNCSKRMEFIEERERRAKLAELMGMES